jgi:hypothetical protein
MVFLLTTPQITVLVTGSTDVHVLSPLLCVCMMSSVWTQSAEVTGSVRGQCVCVTPRGLVECVRLSTAQTLTALDTATALMGCVSVMRAGLENFVKKHVLATGMGRIAGGTAGALVTLTVTRLLATVCVPLASLGTPAWTSVVKVTMELDAKTSVRILTALVMDTVLKLMELVSVMRDGQEIAAIHPRKAVAQWNFLTFLLLRPLPSPLPQPPQVFTWNLATTINIRLQ